MFAFGWSSCGGKRSTRRKPNMSDLMTTWPQIQVKMLSNRQYTRIVIGYLGYT